MIDFCTVVVLDFELKIVYLRANLLQHPLPKVDETLAQMSGGKVFSKLDANSGIPLAKKSRLLTTFITPSGQY